MNFVNIAETSRNNIVNRDNEQYPAVLCAIPGFLSINRAEGNRMSTALFMKSHQYSSPIQSNFVEFRNKKKNGNRRKLL